MDIVAIVGTATGTVSLLGIIYILGYRIGRIELRIGLLWKVYVEDALNRGRQDGLLGSGLTEKGEALLPEDLKQDCREWCRKKKKANPDIAIPDIVQHIGMERLSQTSNGQDISVKGVVALVYAYCRTLLIRE